LARLASHFLRSLLHSSLAFGSLLASFSAVPSVPLVVRTLKDFPAVRAIDHRADLLAVPLSVPLLLVMGIAKPLDGCGFFASIPVALP
jgi:hypothetical protein